MTDKEEMGVLAEARDARSEKCEEMERRREAIESTPRMEFVLHEGTAGDVRNWKELKKVISLKTVESILGKPVREDQTVNKSFEYGGWIHPEGKVGFHKDKLSKWNPAVLMRVPNALQSSIKGKVLFLNEP